MAEPNFNDRFNNNLPDYTLTPVDYDPWEKAAQRTRAPYEKANQRVSGLPDVLNVIGGRVKSGLTAPLDALTGDLQVNDPETNMPTREAIGRSMDTASLAGSGGIGGTEGGAVLGSGPVKPEPPGWGRVKAALRDKDTGEIHTALDRNETHEHILARRYEKENNEYSGEDYNSIKKLYAWEKNKNFEDGFYDGRTKTFYDRNEGSPYHGIDSTMLNPRRSMRSDQVWSDTQKPGMLMSSIMNENKVPPFYSALEHAVINVKQEKMPADQWLGTISNSKGVKPEELDWTGFKDYLAEKGKQPVTKGEVQGFINSNKVELKEVGKGNKDTGEVQRDPDGTILPTTRETKYSQYQLPGGENYREMLMTMPVQENFGVKYAEGKHRLFDYKTNDYVRTPDGKVRTGYDTAEAANEAAQGLNKTAGNNPMDNYQSSHWDEPNILAHVRMNDRFFPDESGSSYGPLGYGQTSKDAKGIKSLHLEEIQSDWHQQGRDKGYKQKTHEIIPETRDGIQGYKVGDEFFYDREHAQNYQDKFKEGVPDAPFKKSWHELALKRMIREAAEKGYDRLSWTPGEAQAARYDLSKSVNLVVYKDGKLTAIGKDGQHIINNQPVEENKLSDYLGKEGAKKLLEQETHNGGKALRDADLKIGGEGMKGFYDQIIPKAIEKIGKEHGVKVKTIGTETNPKGWKITPPTETASGKWMVKSNDYNSKGFHFDTKAEAEANLKQQIEGERTPKQPIHYIDIPQSLKDTALGKGFPLFSSGLPFSLTPVDDPWKKK